MKVERKNPRVISLIVLMCVIFCIYACQLFRWQILEGEHYLLLANQSNTYSMQTEPIRGEILDANGIGLAVNFTGLRLYFDRFSIKEENLNETILSLVDLLNLKGERWIDELPIEVDSDNKYQFIKDKEDEVSTLKSKRNLNMNDYATANDCMSALAEKYKCKDYDPVKRRVIVSVRYNMTKSGYDNSYNNPYTFAEGVSPETVSIVLENNEKYEGVKVSVSTVRRNINGTIAPHIVGIVGALSQEDYEELKDKGYKLNDRKGKSGIELVCESYLRGAGGKKLVEMKRDGTILNILDTQNAAPGNTVYLTIDAKIQKLANESLKRNIESARNNFSDCIAGGAVVMDVKNFSIIAASTYPTYDLTKFLSDINYFNEVMKDKNKPTFDRALLGAFAPGSIFKPAVACAALAENKIDKDVRITCNHSFNPFPGSDFVLKCMGTHGSINLKQAMAKSCNIFFAEAGRRAGIDAMNLYSKRLGLGVDPGLELPCTKGVLAGRESSESDWMEGSTLHSAIGQSDNMFSPLQLAIYAATIANGGNRYRPHILKKITDYSREKIIYENNSETSEVLDKLSLSPENLELVRSSMREVVLSGTAADFSSYPVEIAAKTGTAENPGTDHVTFICFAPYNDPQIAVSVVIEHGGMSMYSKNVARDILNGYFLKQGLPEILPITSLEQVDKAR